MGCRANAILPFLLSVAEIRGTIISELGLLDFLSSRHLHDPPSLPSFNRHAPSDTRPLGRANILSITQSIPQAAHAGFENQDEK